MIVQIVNDGFVLKEFNLLENVLKLGEKFLGKKFKKLNINLPVNVKLIDNTLEHLELNENLWCEDYDIYQEFYCFLTELLSYCSNDNAKIEIIL